MNYLSKKSIIEQRIKEELQQNGIKKETLLDNFDLLDKCEYINCIIKEILRLAPLTIGSIRTLTQNIIIDGVKIRKGESVVSVFSFMPNDSRNWKWDPTQFIPEQFYGINAPNANHHPFVSATLGGGYRPWIGQDNGGHLQRMTVIPNELVVSIESE
jgi:cytochrome P450